MTTPIIPEKAPFAAHTSKGDKRRAGRTSAAETQLEVRGGGHTVEPELRAWIHERMGRQLGKYATVIERVMVRFGDVNGPRGGVDKACLIHIVLSSLPAINVEEMGTTLKEAFDLAAKRAERATRRTMQKHGFSSKTGNGQHDHSAEHADDMDMEGDSEAESSADGVELSDSAGSDSGLFGRREGHRQDNLEDVAARPEKEQRDVYVDTSLPGVSASDRKAGYGHTARRNTKLNSSGMAAGLEDSTEARLTRKSSRGGNGVKSASPLTLRTKSAVQSPKARATRG